MSNFKFANVHIQTYICSLPGLTIDEQGTQFSEWGDSDGDDGLATCKECLRAPWCLHAQSQPDNLHSFYLRQQQTSSLFVASHHFKPHCKAQGLDKSSWNSLKNMIWLFQSDGQWQWPWLASAENTCLGSATCSSTFCKIQTWDVCSAQCLCAHVWMRTCYFTETLRANCVKHVENRSVAWFGVPRFQDTKTKTTVCIVAQHALIAILVTKQGTLQSRERAKKLLRRVKTVLTATVACSTWSAQFGEWNMASTDVRRHFYLFRQSRLEHKAPIKSSEFPNSSQGQGHSIVYDNNWNGWMKMIQNHYLPCVFPNPT